MKHREGLGLWERAEVRVAAAGLAGLAAVSACSSGTSTPKPTPRPTSTVSSPQKEGCVELTASMAGASPDSGTTYEMVMIGIWRSAIVSGERFKFIREGPNPHGPGSHTQTPVIGIDQGRLPAVLHTFPPVSTPEKFLIEGFAIGEDGRQLPGQCNKEITIVPVHEPQGPQGPQTPVLLTHE